MMSRAGVAGGGPREAEPVEDALESLREPFGADAGRGADEYLGDLARAAARQIGPRRVQGEAGEGGRPEPVGGSEGSDADDADSHWSRSQQDGGGAEPEVAGFRRTPVDDRLVVGQRGAATAARVTSPGVPRTSQRTAKAPRSARAALSTSAKVDRVDGNVVILLMRHELP